MQNRWVGSIGDFGKLALLRSLVNGRRLAVCWYVTRRNGEDAAQPHGFDYLHRLDDFRNLAPDTFDALRMIVNGGEPERRCIRAIEASGLLDGAIFHSAQVPDRAASRQHWSSELVRAIDEADFVFLDPDNGIQGKRLTPKHVSLSEIAALRREDRALMIGQRHSGRHSEARVLAERMRSLGCHRIELIRFRVTSPRFYVVADHDDAISERLAHFSRKWGDWVRTYAI
jgi:hypothetical protein